MGDVVHVVFVELGETRILIFILNFYHHWLVRYRRSKVPTDFSTSFCKQLPIFRAAVEIEKNRLRHFFRLGETGIFTILGLPLAVPEILALQDFFSFFFDG